MRLSASRQAWLLACIGWLALVAAALAWRPLTAIDETRYATVAWEMWLSGDAISLRLNGMLYGDKPPLLFWLINLGWWVTGPNTWWPQLLTALFALGALALLLRLARRLAPDHDAIAAMSVLIAASTLFWMAFTAAVMFDLVLTFFVLLAVLAVANAASAGGWRWWLVAGAAIGLGILTKGPVALLHVLPLALLAPWWRVAPRDDAGAGAPGWRRWYAGVALAVAVAAAIALAWAVPAAVAGGDAFRREIFWSQSVDRMASTSHHWQPPWFYLVALPVLLLPWTLLPSVWRGAVALARGARVMPGLRAAIAWTLPVVLAFSLFRGKQPQYLLPEVPALAFMVACALHALTAVRRWESALVASVIASLAIALIMFARQPAAQSPSFALDVHAVWLSAVLWVAAALAIAVPAPGKPTRAVAVVAIGSVVFALGIYAGFGRGVMAIYDVAPMARQLAAAQAAGRPLAHFGKYHGQYQFAGRLQQRLEVIVQPQALRQWAADHPHGGVIVYSRTMPEQLLAARPEFSQPFKSGYLALWRGDDFARIGADGLRALNGGP